MASKKHAKQYAAFARKSRGSHWAIVSVLASENLRHHNKVLFGKTPVGFTYISECSIEEF